MDRPTAPFLDPQTPFLTDPAAQALCASLEGAGFQALFVGGCVRNAIMGLPASDIDISTDAVPSDVIALTTQAGFRAIPTGIDHGTITVVVDGTPFEVTTFRRDVATDGRRAVVAFSTEVGEDARRRDFTMNAIYADRSGMIIDPLGGLPDARARHVRFIEDAGQRIREDFLRTLRFFRFSAFYAAPDHGWDDRALAEIAANLDGLETLSPERVGSEMIKLLSAPDPTPALAVMDQTGVLARVLPGANITFVGPLVHLEHSISAPVDALARLAALGGHDAQTRLRLSRKDQKHLDSIQRYSTATLGPKALGYVVGKRAATGALLLRHAMANTPITAQQLSAVAHGATATFPVSAKDLPDLNGAALGTRLKEMKDAWLESDLRKTRNALLHG